MHNDETVWQNCGETFCSFRVKFLDQVLCRNVYNVDGLCSRVTCPLANGYYGTILEEKGRCYLYLKTIERAHTPRRLWERILLPEDDEKAVETIRFRMTNIYSDKQIEMCVNRLKKIREVLARMRVMAREPETIYEFESQKTRRREQARESKALRAANIRQTVTDELLERLKTGQYGELYNFPQADFEAAIIGGDQEDVAEETDTEDEAAEGEKWSDDEAEEQDIEDIIFA